MLPLTRKIKEIMSKNLSATSFAFAMIVILILGCVLIAILYFFLNPRQNPIALQDYQPVTSSPVSLTLDLSSPDDNLLVFDSNLLISGKTAPGALILITENDQNFLLNASAQGYFSQTVKLSPLVNQLSISSFDNLGNYKTEQRTAFYSEEKL